MSTPSAGPISTKDRREPTDPSTPPVPPEPSGTPPASPPRGGRRWWPVAVLIAWLVVGGGLISQAVNLPEVIERGATAYLPDDSESRQVVELTDDFGDESALPAVVVWTRESGLTAEDRAAIESHAQELADELAPEMTATGLIGPIPSEDGTSLQVVLPVAGTDAGHAREVVETIRADLSPPEGVTARVTGPAGIQTDMQLALGAIDVLLVLVTCTVILLILLAVYRSVLLPFLVITVGMVALGSAHGAVFLLADAGIMRMGAEVQGIMSVLVLGCATDYAMLLIRRYDQRLAAGDGRAVALRRAWSSSWEPIVASAATVFVGLMCLLLSSLGLNQQLGPAAAVGVLIAMAAMLTLMPALLALLGPAVFWPRKHTGRVPPIASRIGRLILARPRPVWIITSLVLLLAATGVMGLRTGALTDGDMVIGSDVESRLGQEQLDAHYEDAVGSPAMIIVDEEGAAAAEGVALETPGVESVQAWTGGDPAATPVVVDGMVRLDATLEHGPDTPEAAQTVVALREGLAETSDEEAPTLVGGQSAVRVDFNASAEEDQRILVLLAAVVLVIISLLLRSVVGGFVVVGSVILSFFAALGVSTWVFQDLLGFPGVDSTFPIHAFVFLVALGVDYSIFLMSRVRERVLVEGPRLGVVRGLDETSGVITSAGMVLAATFAALALVPIVLMVQLAFIVAFGILLDTFVVRTLLVPALSVDLGRWMWWPNRKAMRAPEGAEEGEQAHQA